MHHYPGWFILLILSLTLRLSSMYTVTYGHIWPTTMTEGLQTPLTLFLLLSSPAVKRHPLGAKNQEHSKNKEKKTRK